MLRARLGGSGVLWPLLPAAGDRAHDDPGPEPEDDQVDDHLPGDHQPGRFGLGGDIAEADGGELRGMLAAVTGSAPAWRTALGELPIVRGGRWAVGGSACLALHGLPVDPRDLDLLADHVAAAELVDGLRGAVVSDEARWDRGDARAVRRALAVVHGVEVEILEGVEAVGPTGEVVVATPDLDQLDQIIVSGRRIPVLPLPAMQVLLDATGNRERAAMIAKVLGGADDTQGS